VERSEAEEILGLQGEYSAEDVRKAYRQGAASMPPTCSVTGLSSLKCPARRFCRFAHWLGALSRRCIGAKAREADRDASARAYANIHNCPGGQARGGARAPCRSLAIAAGSVTRPQTHSSRPALNGRSQGFRHVSDRFGGQTTYRRRVPKYRVLPSHVTSCDLVTVARGRVCGGMSHRRQHMPTYSSQRLTNALIRNAKPGETLSDAACPGLSLRVTKTGRKVFSFRYRVGTKQRRITLGEWSDSLSLDQARARAISTKDATDDGRDPGIEKKKRKSGITFEEAAQLYQAGSSPGPPSRRTTSAGSRLLDQDRIRAPCQRSSPRDVASRWMPRAPAAVDRIGVPDSLPAQQPIWTGLRALVLSGSKGRPIHSPVTGRESPTSGSDLQNLDRSWIDSGSIRVEPSRMPPSPPYAPTLSNSTPSWTTPSPQIAAMQVSRHMSVLTSLPSSHSSLLPC